MCIPRVGSTFLLHLLSTDTTYLEGCTRRGTRRCPRLVTMPVPMMELRPMQDIRLMVTCPQCTVHTRCTRRAITNGHLPFPPSSRQERRSIGIRRESTRPLSLSLTSVELISSLSSFIPSTAGYI
jgi:hypothetical protein